MSKLLDEIKYDLSFIKSHSLQPGWYKFLKVFILLGFLAVYWWLSGLMKTVIFFFIFILLSILLHLLYRFKTNKFTQTWLDFKVVEDAGGKINKSIGIFYYLAIVLNAIISTIISQVSPTLFS